MVGNFFMKNSHDKYFNDFQMNLTNNNIIEYRVLEITLSQVEFATLITEKTTERSL